VRRRLLLLLPAIWLIALLSAPAIAYVTGTRQPLLENRNKEPFPPINRSSVRSPEVFAKLDRALLDRLPLRGDALRLRASIALRWFGVSPSPEVVPGRGGWLYMWRDFRPCQPGDLAAGQDPADAAEVIARTAGASGRRIGVLVAGSKTATQPEHLRTDADRALARCVAKREEHVHARLRQTPGGIDITRDLQRELAAGRDVFMKRDSHWQGNAQLIFTRAMLEAAQPGLAQEVDLRQVTQPRAGEADLTRLIGLPVYKRDRYPPIARRPKAYPQARPGETILIGDSQMRLAMTDQLEGRPPISGAALPGPLYCERSKFNTGVCDGQLAASRIVLLEWVARDMQDLTTACKSFPAALLPGIRERLPARAVGLVGATGEGRLPRRLRVGPSATSVRFAPADGGVADALRLLVIPVERLGTAQPGGPDAVTVVQRTTDGRAPVPCETATTGAGGAVILPLTAGRDAAKIVLDLTAPPGTVLGTPQAFVLDDAAVERGMRAALRR
jgi:hypothetical protein